MTNNMTSCYSQTQSTNGQIDLHNIIEETEQNREEEKKLMKKIMWTESERAGEFFPCLCAGAFDVVASV